MAAFSLPTTGILDFEEGNVGLIHHQLVYVVNSDTHVSSTVAPISPFKGQSTRQMVCQKDIPSSRIP